MKPNIMIIDDEPDICTYLMMALMDSGYRTCTNEEGEPILDAIVRHRPDLIILDIMMPRRSGISIYREILNHPQVRTIPVALMSGIEKASDIFNDELETNPMHCMPPPSAFIEKPIRIKKLALIVEQIIGKKGVCSEPVS